MPDLSLLGCPTNKKQGKGPHLPGRSGLPQDSQPGTPPDGQAGPRGLLHGPKRPRRKPQDLHDCR
eukprot:6178788-Pyramimonas_sp.AAC.1